MKSFDEVFADNTKYCTKIKTVEYKEKGKYIIIDQGQTDIAGYTDLEDGLFVDVPAIIFGDHTRIIKYVDKPFFIGADGVKILKSKFDNVSYKYLFYALKNVKIPNTGYNRHFKWLKETKIKYPDNKKQQEIADTLDKLQSIITHRKQQLEKLDELVKARFVEMFGDDYEQGCVGDYISELTGGKSLAGTENCVNKVLCTGSVSYDYFIETEVKNLPLEYKPDERHLVCEGDLLISRMNTLELVGAAAYVRKAPKHTYIPDRIWKAKVTNNSNPIFVWQLLIHPLVKAEISQRAGGTSGSMKNISKDKLLSIPVPIVPKTEQNKFVEFVEQTDKSKAEVQKALDKAQLLFDSLMQEYFG